jgi:hypothetical protein
MRMCHGIVFGLYHAVRNFNADIYALLIQRWNNADLFFDNENVVLQIIAKLKKII